jgi:hypothetical protein
MSRFVKPVTASLNSSASGGICAFGDSDNAEMFIGFYSDTASISKLTITV